MMTKIFIIIGTVFFIIIATSLMLRLFIEEPIETKPEIMIGQFVDCVSILEDKYKVSTRVWVHKGESSRLEKFFFNSNVKCEDLDFIKDSQMRDAEKAKLIIENVLKNIKLGEEYWNKKETK
jgi:hypothetical protein